MNRHKDVVTASGIFDTRAASIRVDSYPSLVVNLDEALRPPLLRVMRDTGHCILSPLKKMSSCRTSVACFCEYGYLFMSFTISMGKKSISY
jgi:hypothetical protein